MNVPGFTTTEFSHDGVRKPVFRAGEGPAVIVMTEVPGITPQVARFAQWVVEAGFTVFMPQLIGTPMRPVTPMAVAGSFARLCINREFRLFAAHQSSPVVDWLRALARDAHAQCGGPGVGAIGMCLTGNFALSMMLDAPVLAPVLAQPSLPVAVTRGMGAALHASPQEIAAAHDKIDHHGARILGLRFQGDPYCPPARFNTLRAEFGDAFESIELDARHAKPDEMKPAHSMLTTHLIDAAGEPTRAALDRTLRFFAEQLKP
ncbi:MAG: dienelactone hydrolase family protein [Polycyclovorans sp.]|jgi:dienelactone hydrolase|nr:dienelactone hydrolase family protein [Polycyclovorans sp.]|tara:strand:+ start:6883 stop:7665 length:783 start_codon:yes stop_codon:yes gene_type:complete